MRYVVYSKGLHATWLLNCEYSALFDCGEGCATQLGYRVFVPDRLFISHSHIDHVSGLPAFLGLRNSTKGANDKPLCIYYPAGNNRVEEWLQFSQKQAGRLKYPLSVQPLQPREKVPLPTKTGSRELRYVEAFPVQHAADPCYGYRIVSMTRKLKPEHQGKGKEFYSSLSPAAKEALSEDALTTRFFFSGDAMPLRSGPDSPLNGAEVAFLDSTFLAATDREGNTHAAMEEVAQKCAIAGVRVAYAMHLSIRYSMDEIRKKIQELQSVFPLRLIPYDEITYLN
jgi:ribonuclease Z